MMMMMMMTMMMMMMMMMLLLMMSWWWSLFQCRSYLDPSEVFKGEVEETVVKVKMVVSNLTALKDIYDQHRKKIKDFFRHGEPKDWEFAPVLVFHRYDKFLERVQLIYVRHWFSTGVP